MEGNGVLFPGKSDVEKLADSLNDTDEQEDTSSQIGTIPKQPTYSDINKYVKNLNMLVGTGFVLLHNDLEQLIKAGGSGSGGDWKVALVAAIAAAIPGVMDSVTESLTAVMDTFGDNLRSTIDSLGDNIVKIISTFKSDKNIDFILEDESLNQEILASEDIRTLRKAYTKGYLKAYYSNLIANFGYEYDYENDALTEKTSVGSVGSDLIGGLTSGIAEGITAVYDGIAQSMAGHELDNDPDVNKIRKLGYSAYLRAYYVNLMSPYGWAPTDINADEWKLYKKEYDLKQLLSDAGQSLGSLVAGTIGPVLNSITDSIADATLNGDEGIRNIRKLGYSAYLRAYYVNLMSPFGWAPDDINADTWKLHRTEYDFKQFLSDLGQGLGELLSGPLKAITSTLTNSVVEGFLSTDEDIKAVRKRGYLAYLKAYYHNLLEPYGYHVGDINSDNWSLIKNENYSAKEFFKDLADILSEFLKSGLTAITQSLTDATANAFLNGDEEIKSTRRKGYKAYLRLYYKSLIEAFGYTVDLDNLNKDEFIVREAGYGEGKLRGDLNDAWETVKSALGFGGGSNTVSFFTKLDDSDLNNDDEVRAVRKIGYKSVLNHLYSKIENTIDGFNTGSNSDLYEILEGTYIKDNSNQGLVRWWANNTKFDDTNISEDPDVRTERINGYKNLLGSLYSKMTETVNGISKSDSTVKSYAQSMLKSLSEAMSDTTFGDVQTTIVNEAKDYTDKLNKIMDCLLTIKNSSQSLYSIQESVEGMSGSVETIANKPTGTYGASPMGSSFEGTPSKSGGN